MCPKCGSSDTWDDNFWWGCNRCSFMQNFENSVIVTASVMQSESRQRAIWRCEDEADDGE